MAIFESLRNIRNRSVALEHGWDRNFGSFSKFLWPWHESRLMVLVITGAILDYLSTYVAFRFGNNNVSEIGLIANWGLQTGGFVKLLLLDAGLLAVLLSLAAGVRFLYTRLGLPGYGRFGFIIVLIPYAALILAVVFNNVYVSFVSQY